MGSQGQKQGWRVMRDEGESGIREQITLDVLGLCKEIRFYHKCNYNSIKDINVMRDVTGLLFIKIILEKRL